MCYNIDYAYYFQELWHPFLVFLVPTSADASLHLQALDRVVTNGNRKKFALINKESILQTVSLLNDWCSISSIACCSKAQEDAKNARVTSGGVGGKKSKQSSVPSLSKPMHVQVRGR